MAVVLSPDLPPKRGGVADHTDRLLRELQARIQTGVITSTGNVVPERLSPVKQIAGWKDASVIWEAVSTLPRNAILLWQWVPHMYGRGGVNAAVPEVIARWQAAGRRQIVLVHELYAPWSILPNRWYYARQQRRQWRIIRDSADALGMSTETWLASESVRPGVLNPGRFFLCSSPSNIPIATVPPDHAASWRGERGWSAGSRVIAVFGSLGLPSRWKWVERACSELQASGTDARWVTVGQGSIDLSKGRREWFHSMGFVDARAVSGVLQACDILAVPYLDGVSERRCSAMAGLAHGCCVATTLGHGTGPTMSQGGFMGLIPADDAAGFSRMLKEMLLDADRRRELGGRAREAYVKHYDWPVIVDRIHDRLMKLAGRAEPT